MKNKLIIIGCLAATLGVIGLTGCATDEKEHTNITKAQATAIAMSKAPGGTIKEGELEKEGGKLIWSFDIAMPGTKNTTEVNIDAITGETTVSIETPSQEAKEKD